MALMDNIVEITLGVAILFIMGSSIILPFANDYAGSDALNSSTSNLSQTETTVAGLVTIFGLLAVALAVINAVR